MIQRQASGLVHLLLSASLKHTPLAALSRPVAGTIKNSLVVTLPGSVKAVKENLEALLSAGVIDHALDLIKGGSGTEVHSAMPSSSEKHAHQSHSHDHAPKRRAKLSHDPSLPGKFSDFHIVFCKSLTGIYSNCSTSRIAIPDHIARRGIWSYFSRDCSTFIAEKTGTKGFDLQQLVYH